MATPQDLFTAATGDDATVAADQSKLDADTAQAVTDHAGLVAAVTKPTLVKTSDGTLVALIPNANGTLDNIILLDGSAPTP